MSGNMADGFGRDGVSKADAGGEIREVVGHLILWGLILHDKEQ